MSTSIRAGQVYRDTYYDSSDGICRRNRTIQITKVMVDRILAITITDCFGKRHDRPRKTRMSVKTLTDGYEFVADAAS